MFNDFDINFTGAQAILNSFYGKPNTALHLSSVVCRGSEDRLVECAYELVPLEDGKNIVKHIDVVGVSCKKTASVSPPSILSTTPPAVVNDNLKANSTSYVIYGVLAIIVLIALMIIIL